MKMVLNKYCILILVLLLALGATGSYAQEGDRPEESQIEEPLTLLWINTYGNIRISNRLFWVAQTHFRFQEDSNTEFAGQIAQLYNRHAIGYIFNKSFNASLGGVLRINFNTKEPPEGRNAVTEWRIWHQYKFAMPLSSLMIYHRLRIEHRWSQGFAEDAEFVFRNRWRYMIRVRVPLNKPKLGPETFYVGPEAELIMQSGKVVVDSPMEDLRLHTSFGYIVNPRVTVATGFMYSIGQELADGAFYKTKWTLRFHVYFSPDLRKVKYKLPSIHLDD